MKKILNVIKENKAFIFPWVILVGVVVILASGLTYAYFDFVADSENESSMKITATDLKINLSNPTVDLSDMMPIYDDYKDTKANTFTFTMSNTSKKLSGCVDLYLNITSITPELKNSDFKWELKNTTTNTTSSGDFTTIDESNRLLLKANENISIGATYSYTLKIWLSYDDNKDQSYVQGASMSSKIMSIAYGGACSTPVSTSYTTVGTTQFTASEDGYYRIETYNINGDYASGEIMLADNEKLYFSVSDTDGTPTSVKCYADSNGICGTQGTQNEDNSRIMYAKTDLTNSFMSGYAGVNAPIYVTNSNELSYNTIHPTGKFFLNGKLEFATGDTTPKVVVTYLGKYRERNELLNNVRYIKDCVSGNTVNTNSHWVEIQAMKNGVNIAYKKTLSGSVTNQILVDGVITTSAWSGATGSGNKCVTVDLGRIYDLDEVAVWHYYGDGRTYHNNITSVSLDNSNWVTIRDESVTSEMPETVNGKRISAYDLPNNSLYNVVKKLVSDGYAAKYTGAHNDTYGETGTKDIYYIKPNTDGDVSTLLNKINVKFAGYCWQILRTTDTGGVKLIYNGEPDSNGYCKAINTQDTHKGVIAASNGSAVAMSGDYQYADSYTYDLDAGTFTLVNPSQDNYANNKNLIGKYTCKTSSSTTQCSTLYYLNTPNRESVNSPYTVTYTIGDTQNAQLGTTPFNANYRSPAYVGYKYGTAYDYAGNSAPTSGSIMGHDVYWNGSNYELREANNSVSSGTEYNTNHHYTCNSNSATCTGGKVRFYYYGNYYIELLNGDDIDTALTRMLEENKYDSAMKSYLENWFRNKMLAYKDYLDENTVYCNDRTITQIGGWTNTGGIGTGSTNYLKFNNYDTVTNLSCTKDTDKFSVGNSNAELNYPVGLATAPEMNIITNATLRTTGQYFWLVSPFYFTDYYANERNVSSSGSMSYYLVNGTYGARPVVSLAPSNDAISGTGAYDNPYVIGE